MKSKKILKGYTNKAKIFRALILTIIILFTSNIDAFACTKILATLGPKSSSVEIIEKLGAAGLNTARVNFSHGTHEQNAKLINNIREAEKNLKKPISILIDLQGPKYRIGRFNNDKVALAEGQKFSLDLNPEPGNESRVSFNHPELYSHMVPGKKLLLDDGNVVLKVISNNKERIETVVETGNELSNNKGVNFPDLNVKVNAITEKDKKDLAFALNFNPDFVALSFVQTSDDIKELRKLINNENIRIMAKIEKPQAVDNIDAIAKEADALMVARGDMGVEMGFEKVPVMQKKIIAAAKKYNKPVVVATQVMNSMIDSNIPTRAEVSDVATAVYSGADFVMLSNETAMGKYPVESVAVMNKVIKFTEKSV